MRREGLVGIQLINERFFTSHPLSDKRSQASPQPTTASGQILGTRLTSISLSSKTRPHFFSHPHFTWLFSPLLSTHAYICLCCIKGVIQRRSRFLHRRFHFISSLSSLRSTAEKSLPGGKNLHLLHHIFVQPRWQQKQCDPPLGPPPPHPPIAHLPFRETFLSVL